MTLIRSVIRMYSPRQLLWLVGFMCCFLLSGAQAAAIQISFTGTLTGTDQPITGMTAGTAVSGLIEYDPNSPISPFSSATEGNYFFTALRSFTLTIGTYTASSLLTSASEISVLNNHDLGGVLDGIIILAQPPVSGPVIDSYEPRSMQFSLFAGIDILSNTDLPSVDEINALWADNFANGNTNFLSFREVGFGPFNIARFDLTSVSAILIQQVPEPATLALLTIALAGLGFRHRKHAAN